MAIAAVLFLGLSLALLRILRGILVHYEYSLVSVLGTGGSSITGGSDVDAILGRYIVNEWSKKHDTDLAVDDSAMALVLQEAEQAKIRLSRKVLL